MGRPERVVVTYDMYRRLPDDGKRYEIYEGEIVMAPAPATRHQRSVGRIYLMLHEFVARLGLGEVFLSPIDIVLAYHTVVQPDVVFVARARVPLLVKDAGIFGAPDLVVEVLSPGTADRDLSAKRQIYEKHCVKEYWIVDPEARSVTVLGLEGEALVEIASGSGDRPLRSRLLAGLDVIPTSITPD